MGGGAFYRDIAGGWGIVNGVYNWDLFTGGHNTRAFPHSFLLENRLARPNRRLDITVAFFKNYIIVNIK